LSRHVVLYLLHPHRLDRPVDRHGRGAAVHTQPPATRSSGGYPCWSGQAPRKFVKCRPSSANLSIDQASSVRLAGIHIELQTCSRLDRPTVGHNAALQRLSFDRKGLVFGPVWVPPQWQEAEVESAHAEPSGCSASLGPLTIGPAAAKHVVSSSLSSVLRANGPTGATASAVPRVRD